MKDKISPSLRRIWYLLRAIAENYSEHRLSMWAAALAYYGLVSIFPLLLFLIYLGSEVLASNNVNEALRDFMESAIPAGVENLTLIVQQTVQLRGPIGLIGGIGLVWAASAVFAALEGALNRIWGGAPRPFLGQRLLASGSILLLSGAFVLLLTVGQFVPILITNLPMANPEQILDTLVGVGIMLAIYLVHRAFPNRSVGRWPALAAAGFSGVTLIIARRIFDALLNSAFVNYGTIYGSLAWVVSLGIWTYVSGSLFLLGAEVGHTLDKEGVFDELRKRS